jgi:hypothetical protein
VLLYLVLYDSAAYIIYVVAGHAARMGRGGMHIGYWWESQKEGAHLVDQDVDGWTILKWILER